MFAPRPRRRRGGPHRPSGPAPRGRRRRAAPWAALFLCACGGGHTTPAPAGGGGGSGTTLNPTFDPGFTQVAPNAPNSVQVTFSGETFGANGLPLTPASPGDPVFVDGWSVSFDSILVVVANVRLTAGATASPDQGATGAAVVAQRAGPFVLDMHRPQGLVGADGQAPAGGIFAWDAQDGGQPFDTGARYGFSYDVVAARYPATQVNLRPAQFAAYDTMVRSGWSKMVAGTATYVGTGSHPDAAAQAQFAALPAQVHFVLGVDDAGGQRNCINPALGSGADLADRGVQTNSNGAVVAQITLHADHFFWDRLQQEGALLRFDPIAAWAPADTTQAPLALHTLAQPLAATFADGSPLPDRAPYQGVPGGYTSDQANPAQVVLGRNGVPADVVRNLADFVAFSGQSQMHLNADGLCYAVGQSAGDPWYVPALPR